MVCGLWDKIGDHTALKNLMEIAIDEAKKALELEEVPIGCAVFHKGRCIDTAHNLTNKNRDPLAHAEMLCLERLPKEMLSEIELYVTCEPCIMCLALIIKLGIRTVVYACINPRFGGLSPFVAEGILSLVEKKNEPESNDTDYTVKNDQKTLDKYLTNKIDINDKVAEDQLCCCSAQDANLAIKTEHKCSSVKVYSYTGAADKSASYIKMVYQPAQTSLDLLKSFYMLENGRAPVEKRKVKNSQHAKNFKNDTGRE
ncbi:tRNA-specific adenosine deaminase 2 [Nematocida minor]|uniref:tRNA-specific adenosine deaminase 2 n=1 Tax=Nematocida minor TaxID=1912983 RepID=UPI00221E9173|nr:tRNA-specific adenosine deaminase 2 [Nematocida minor]KAI5192424.1 tRNA-specific adenosine deaminase 2 [Nematocida minor]